MFSLSYKSPRRGFSLIELLVSVSIMVLITAIVVTNERGYDKTQALNNAVNTMALDIRSAEVYGTGVRETTPGGGDFSHAYGFYTQTTPFPTTKYYMLFTDADNDGGMSETDPQTRVDLPSGAQTTVCAILLNNSCTPLGYKQVFITFLRPNPTPHIVVGIYPASLTDITVIGAQGIRLTVTLNGVARSVSVYRTGQVSVQ